MSTPFVEPVPARARRRWAMSYPRDIPHPPERVFRLIARLGGSNGYPYADVLWRIRGWMDRLLGGPGVDRSRQQARPRKVGLRIDFWIVESVDPPHVLELKTDLRMPGSGALRVDVAPNGTGSTVTLTASFEPRGPLGWLYWYSLYPIHDFVFRGTLRAIAREAERVAERARRTAPFRPVRSPRPAPCRAACPAGNDVRGWVALVAQRDRLGLGADEAYRRAFGRLAATNPFPATTGRVCPHPCEDGCNRTPKDGAVAVHAIERFLGDWSIERGLALPTIQGERRTESVGVVGSGPAGLSYAYQMARRGYPVTVYERASKPGGMLRWGIPRYRLPESVLDAEIDRVRSAGVEIVLDAGGGGGRSLDDLRTRHDAVFVAIGAQCGRRLGIPGEDLPGVRSGIDYLRQVHEGEPPDLRGRVVVIGGGDTAVDAARVARRTGAAVEILYRRGREHMPAIGSEVDDAITEGVSLEPWCAPAAIEPGPGGSLSLRVQAFEPGEPDGQGRPRPERVEGSEREVVADTVLVAVAQQPDWTGLERTAADAAVQIGGDVVQAGIACEAIGIGRRAAETMDARFRGREEPGPSKAEVPAREVKPDLYPASARVRPERLPPVEAVASADAEIRAGITAEQFDQEAARCLSCGQCFGCENCFTFCMYEGFEAVAEPAPGRYYRIDLDPCRGCGKCAGVCPSGFLQVQTDAAAVGR